MKNCFISTYQNEWMAPASVLRDHLGFEIVELNGKIFPSISSKWILLKKEWNNVRNILRHFKTINHSHILICSNYAALFLLLLQKMKILKADTICWFGVYIHSPKMVELVGKAIRLLSTGPDRFKIVVFSRGEQKLYSDSWRIPENSFLYIPYGEWNPQKKDSSHVSDEGYFFSGGYSNRDHVSLVKLFMGRKEKLKLVASRQNTDLVNFVKENCLSDNIEIFWDIEPAAFTRLLEGSHCVAFIMQHNTGASGQMVMLSAMKTRKLILCTYTDVLDEYVQHEKEALVVEKSQVADLFPKYIDLIDKEPARFEHLVEAAYEKYQQCFSYEAISQCLLQQIAGLIEV